MPDSDMMPQHDPADSLREPHPERATPDRDSRIYVVAMHLLCLLQTAGMIAALVMWLTRRDADPFVNANGRKLINFQLSILLYSLCCFPLVCVGGIGVPMLIAICVFSVVCTIVAAVTAYEGQVFNYPLSNPFI